GFVGLLAVTQSWRGQDCVATCFLPKASERADAVGAAEPGWRVIALPRDAQIVVSARLLRRNEQGVVAASDVEESFTMAVDVAERKVRRVAGQAVNPGEQRCRHAGSFYCDPAAVVLVVDRDVRRDR